uniref:receptor protein-tyrosine kinase n=1 Tax=Branchiostoma floridae TaxID=7739 RepID=C3ZKD4_BRAFL|eukprot:XP_002591022.1 hypothetical protein BRAFLDRAFT_69425 [Branchiostoma floridae]
MCTIHVGLLHEARPRTAPDASADNAKRDPNPVYEAGTAPNPEVYEDPESAPQDEAPTGTAVPTEFPNPMYQVAACSKEEEKTTRCNPNLQQSKAAVFVFTFTMATVLIYFAVASSAGYRELKSWQLSAGQQLQELETKVLHGFAELHAWKREVEESLAVNVEYSGFRTANFTTLGATGRAGPTSLGDHYRGQDHEKLVTLQNGIQLFTVPETGNYSIEAAGASGGWDVYSFKMTSGRVESVVGRGARVAGTFFLQKAALLKILAGQEGGKNNDTFSSGGGGGTFVTSADDTPLLIAGGGGGIQHLARKRHAECDGTAATEGQDAPWLVR